MRADHVVVFRLNSPAIVYKTTRNVIPTFENINAVKALQWSFARSNGGFCLRRTDRLRSILLPFLKFVCSLLWNYPLSLLTVLTRSHPLWALVQIQNSLPWYPLKYYFLCIQRHPRQKRLSRWMGGEIEIGLIHFLSAVDSFYFGLNFIVKVFHNQNFMLAPPLSFNFFFCLAGPIYLDLFALNGN